LRRLTGSYEMEKKIKENSELMRFTWKFITLYIIYSYWFNSSITQCVEQSE